MKYIALVMDFDDTLTDEAVSRFMRDKGIDVKKFWNDVGERVRGGWDISLAYLDLFINLLKPGEPLEGVTREELTNFGSNPDQYYPGVLSMFEELRRYVRELSESAGVDHTIEYYVISGGLKAIIEGAPFRKELTDFWACDFVEGPTPIPCNTVSFTEKTRFMYLINKGFVSKKYKGNTGAVNIYVPKEERKIPFTNIIYVGDGETDIPCFSMLRQYEGHPFLVLPEDKRTKESTARLKAFRIKKKRDIPLYTAKYTKEDDLRRELELSIENIILG